MIALVDRILLQAMSVSASYIHVEPQQKGLQLRYRQDGVLQQYIEPLPSRLVPAVTSRFKSWPISTSRSGVKPKTGSSVGNTAKG